MTPEELAAIRERDSKKGGDGATWTGSQSDRDRRVLLAEVDRLREQEQRVRTLLDWGVGRPTMGVTRMFPSDDLRAALAGDS